MPHLALDLLPEPPLLDVRYLAEQAGEDVDLQRELLGLFINQCERLAVDLRRNTDPAHVLENLHLLQGSARAIGAAPLAAAATLLELSIREPERALASQQEAASKLQIALSDACRFAASTAMALDATFSPNITKADKHHQPSVTRPDQQGRSTAPD